MDNRKPVPTSLFWPALIVAFMLGLVALFSLFLWSVFTIAGSGWD